MYCNVSANRFSISKLSCTRGVISYTKQLMTEWSQLSFALFKYHFRMRPLWFKHDAACVFGWFPCSAAVDGSWADGIAAFVGRRTVDGNSERRRVQLRHNPARDSVPRRAVPLWGRRRADPAQEWVRHFAAEICTVLRS